MKAPEMDGKKFVLYLLFPLFFLIALLFFLFAPGKPLGGPSPFLPSQVSEAAPPGGE